MLTATSEAAKPIPLTQTEPLTGASALANEVEAFQQAIERGDTEAALAAMEDCPRLAQYRDESGKAALHRAAQSSCGIAVIDGLLQQGADPLVTNHAGRTALHYAVCGSADSAPSVIARLAQLDEFAALKDMADQDLTTPLMLAIRNGRADVVKLLLEHFPLLDLQDKEGRTALSIAAQDGHREIAAFLLDGGASPDIPNKEGRTALMLAVKRGYRDIAQLLIRSGAIVDLKNDDQATALAISANEGYVEIVRMLIEAGADVNTKNKVGRTPLLAATKKAYIEIIETLLHHGAAINAQNKDGRTALMVAANKGHLPLVELFLDNGAEIDLQDKNGRTALMIAANRKGHEIVGVLLRRGASIDIRHKDGRTGLMDAAEKSDCDTLQILLDAGATLDLQNMNGRTALMVAAEKGRPGAVEVLLARGAAVDARDNDGRTALWIAADKGHPAIVQTLLNHGACVDLRNRFGRTALMAAIESANPETVEALYRAGASPHAKCNGGWTSWMLAVAKGDTAMVETLLREDDENPAHGFPYLALKEAALRGDVTIEQMRAVAFADTIERLRSDAPELEALDLTLLAIEHEQLAALTAVLERNTTLKSLALKRTGLRDTELGVLAEALRANSTLTHLDLSDNRDIGPASAQALMDALAINASLTQIDLRKTAVSDVTQNAIRQFLKDNRFAPEQANALLQRGQALEQAGDIVGAVQAYREGIALRRMQRRDRESLSAALSAILPKVEKYFDQMVNKADAHYTAHQYRDAVAAFDVAFQCRPDASDIEQRRQTAQAALARQPQCYEDTGKRIFKQCLSDVRRLIRERSVRAPTCFVCHAVPAQDVQEEDAQAQAHALALRLRADLQKLGANVSITDPAFPAYSRQQLRQCDVLLVIDSPALRALADQAGSQTNFELKVARRRQQERVGVVIPIRVGTSGEDGRTSDSDAEHEGLVNASSVSMAVRLAQWLARSSAVQLRETSASIGPEAAYRRAFLQPVTGLVCRAFDFYDHDAAYLAIWQRFEQASSLLEWEFQQAVMLGSAQLTLSRPETIREPKDAFAASLCQIRELVVARRLVPPVCFISDATDPDPSVEEERRRLLSTLKGDLQRLGITTWTREDTRRDPRHAIANAQFVLLIGTPHWHTQVSQTDTVCAQELQQAYARVQERATALIPILVAGDFGSAFPFAITKGYLIRDFRRHYYEEMLQERSPLGLIPTLLGMRRGDKEYQSLVSGFLNEYRLARIAGKVADPLKEEARLLTAVTMVNVAPPEAVPATASLPDTFLPLSEQQPRDGELSDSLKELFLTLAESALPRMAPAEHDENVQDFSVRLPNASDGTARSKFKELRRSIQAQRNLSALDFSQNNLGVHIGRGGQIAFLKDVLTHHAGLRRLNLSHNHLRHTVAWIADFIAQHPALVSLDLRHNGLKDEDARALAKALWQNVSLTEIHLEGNKLSAVETEPIYRILEQNKRAPVRLRELLQLGADFAVEQNIAAATGCLQEALNLRLPAIARESIVSAITDLTPRIQFAFERAQQSAREKALAHRYADAALACEQALALRPETEEAQALLQQMRVALQAEPERNRQARRLAYRAFLSELRQLLQMRRVQTPLCFISYAWERPATGDKNRRLQSFLVQIQEDLSKLGAQVMLDVTNMQGDMQAYMRQQIQRADTVLLIGTPQLKARAEEPVDAALGENNLQFELNHIRGKLVEHRGTVIPLWYDRQAAVDAVFPGDIVRKLIVAQNRLVDFRDHADRYEETISAAGRGLIAQVFGLKENDREYAGIVDRFGDKLSLLEHELRLAVLTSQQRAELRQHATRPKGPRLSTQAAFDGFLRQLERLFNIYQIRDPVCRLSAAPAQSRGSAVVSWVERLQRDLERVGVTVQTTQGSIGLPIDTAGLHGAIHRPDFVLIAGTQAWQAEASNPGSALAKELELAKRLAKIRPGALIPLSDTSESGGKPVFPQDIIDNFQVRILADPAGYYDAMIRTEAPLGLIPNLYGIPSSDKGYRALVEGFRTLARHNALMEGESLAVGQQGDIPIPMQEDGSRSQVTSRMPSGPQVHRDLELPVADDVVSALQRQDQVRYADAQTQTVMSGIPRAATLLCRLV